MSEWQRTYYDDGETKAVSHAYVACTKCHAWAIAPLTGWNCPNCHAAQLEQQRKAHNSHQVRYSTILR